MAAAIMGDAAVAAGSQEEHLVFEGIGAERPSVAEDHGLSGAPIVEIDLCAVLCRDCAHSTALLGVDDLVEVEHVSQRAAELFPGLKLVIDLLDGLGRQAASVVWQAPHKIFCWVTEWSFPIRS